MLLEPNATLERVIEWIESKKAEDVAIFDLQGKTSYTDFVVVCSASSEMHARAIANHVIDSAKPEKIYIVSKEGMEDGSWILVDFADVILHVMIPRTREYYKLDSLFNEIQTKGSITAEASNIHDDVVEEDE